jgi:alanyl-tRNA synthetase
LTVEQIEFVEDRVNSWIEENHETTIRKMSYRDAVDEGAIAIFEERYGDTVRVVSFGEASTELCGGTHVRATGNIGLFKIISEASVASGVRRLEALTGSGAFSHLRLQERELRDVGSLLKVAPGGISRRVTKLVAERRELERSISELHREISQASSQDLMSKVETVNGISLLMSTVDIVESRALREMVDDFRNRLQSGVVLLVVQQEEGISLALGVTADLTERLSAGQMMREVAQVLGGKGGGRPDFAQAGAPATSNLLEAFSRLRTLLVNA